MDIRSSQDSSSSRNRSGSLNRSSRDRGKRSSWVRSNTTNPRLAIFRSKTRFGVRHIQALLLFFALITSSATDSSLILVKLLASARIDFKNWKGAVPACSVVSVPGYFLGGAFAKFLGGYLTSKFNNKYLMIANALTMFALTEVSAIVWDTASQEYRTTLRIAQAITTSMVIPLVYSQLSQWFPQEELPYIGPLVLSGQFFGRAFILYLGTDLNTGVGGWRSVFYLSANLTLIWTIAYIGFGAQSHREAWYISSDESSYLTTMLGPRATGTFKANVPFVKILRNLPTYALAVCHGVSTSAQFSIVPVFTKVIIQKYKITLERSGLILGTPILLLNVLTLPTVMLAYHLLKTNKVSCGKLRFTANSISFYGMGSCLLMIAAVDLVDEFMTFFVLGYTLLGISLMGFHINHFDLAPNYAGLLCGISSGLGNVIGLLMYLSSEKIILSHPVDIGWRGVMSLYGVIYILSNLIFTMFGSADGQSYNSIHRIIETED